MKMLLLSALILSGRDEAALRETFSREIQAKEAAARVEAVKKLAVAKEQKSIELLAASLKDADLSVRKAAAETLEKSVDGGGVKVKPLGEILVDKKEDLELRMLCAKALATSRYKSETFPLYYAAMTSIGKDEKHLHRFGYDMTVVMESVFGAKFGYDKVTPERWGDWWTDNQEKLKKDDEKAHEEWKKAQG